MGRIKVIDEEKGDFPYYVEIQNPKTSEWVAEVRYYLVKQDVKDFPDNERRRNFKYLGNEDRDNS